MLRQLFWILVLLVGVQMEGKEKPLYKGKKKYDLSVCAIFGEETKYLKEWIEYHQLVGVDHFYLYNNQDHNYAREILRPFIKKGIVSLIPWNQRASGDDPLNGFSWALSSQIPAYENAIYIRGVAETKWLICLDVNEYLLPLKSDKITSILEKYGDYSGLVLSTDCFDSSQINTQLNQRLVIENVDLIFPPKENRNQEVKKTIFKPELCKGFVWPPYQCRFKDDREAVEISRSDLRINRYVHLGKLDLNQLRKKIYINQQNLEQTEVQNLLQEGYKIEDPERAIERFLPQLRKNMGLEGL